MAQEQTKPGYRERIDLARVAYDELKLADALDHYRTAADIEPDSYDAWLGQARTLARMRQPEQSRLAAERCLSLDPRRAEGYVTRGVLGFLKDQTHGVDRIPSARKQQAGRPSVGQLYSQASSAASTGSGAVLGSRGKEWLQSANLRRSMCEGSQNGIQDNIKFLGQILGEETQHKEAMLLQEGVLLTIPPVCLSI